MNDEHLHQLRDASTLLNAIGAVAWEFDWSTGSFTFVSDACERLLGYPRDLWMEPGFWMTHVHSDDIGEAAEYCETSTAQGIDHVFEYRMVRADGAIVWVRDIVTVDPVRRLNGVLRGLLVDITDTKRQESEIETQRDELDRALVELRASEARFRSVVEQAPTGMHLYEMRGDEPVLASANPAADRILGIEHAPLIGQPVRVAFPACGERLDVYRRLALDGGEWQADVPYDDGRIKGVFQMTAFQTIPGQVALMFLDVTEQKAIEQADRDHSRRVSALAAQIASAEDVERRRLAEELHDRVSQPLAVARMRLKSAMDSCPHEPGGASQALELLEQAIGETRAVTTELYPPILRELGIAAALGWLAEEVCRIHHLRCEVRLDEDIVGLAEEVECFLFRTARELLMNVVKHADTPVVWVSLDRLGDVLALTVADDGRGFDASGVSGPQVDSGFGLFSISERIGYLGGSLDVESSPDTGTKVTVRVPSAAVPA